MLLAIDVGNTGIKFGVFNQDKLESSWTMATSISRKADEYAALLLHLLYHSNMKSSDISDSIICSVVPPLNTTLVEMVQKYFKVTPLVVAAGVKTGVKICMDNPKEVGADRIVNAAAAKQIYGHPVIVVDIGTATTFDVVSVNGDYIGGVIAPGIKTASDALVFRAAKLPRVELIRPKNVVGTNTIDAMQSGIVFGYVGLINEIIMRIKKEIEGNAKVVATGGDADLICNETSVIDVLDQNLTLEGLQMIYKMNRQLK